jgi:phosphatidylglycerol---prolipoprotein diacylglyceryl transferase
MWESFVNAWQHLPGDLNPVMIGIGTLKIRWYGFMYLVVLGITYFLARYRVRTERLGLSTEILEKVFFWGMAGVILGARLGYVFFYNFGYYFQHPIEIVLPFQFSPHFQFVGYAGMSYHGGLICLALSIFWLEQREHLPAFTVADLLATTFPLGYTFGRLGNFINGELYGRVTDHWWGMYFPADESGRLRHPSQLYEAFFEGIVLFILMWSLRRRRPFPGFHTAIYVMGYGVIRFFIEFVRQPDYQLGTLWGNFTMGQILCLAMITCGGMLMLVQSRKRETGKL